MTNPTTGMLLSYRYRIEKQLGSGGFGETYLAQDEQLPGKPQCVVKLLKPFSQEPEVLTIARRLFDQEASVLQNLGQHDQIPRLLAHFEQDGEFYLVQEFVEGEDLSHQLVNMDERKTISLLVEILEVLQFVHTSKVIHRDIKPSNLMRRKKDDKLVMIDFGSVKEIRNQTTIETGQRTITVSIGSPGYMPSEQAAGNPRFCSDIYAVGVLGIQALTRVTVPESIPKDPDTDELQWRGLVQTAVSEGLERILNKMVCAYFPYRYQSAGEVLTDLEGLSGGNKPTTAVSNPKVMKPVATVLSNLPVSQLRKPDRGIPWKEWKEWKSYLPVGVGVLGLGMGLLLFNLVRERTD
ncbi:MAG: serine/threonine-protein kinase, partial [Synechococcales bacterium]|nr:serine/threonine-protein kinase [Synechococcales bacterium]